VHNGRRMTLVSLARAFHAAQVRTGPDVAEARNVARALKAFESELRRQAEQRR